MKVATSKQKLHTKVIEFNKKEKNTFFVHLIDLEGNVFMTNTHKFYVKKIC